MMKNNYGLFMIVSAMMISSVLIGCANSAGTSSQNSSTLPGMMWVLRKLDGEKLDMDHKITLLFEEDKLSGNASCNSYLAPYSLRGERLKIGLVGSTLMACPDVEYETRYMQALAKVHSLRYEGEQLELINNKGDVTLVFAPMLHASLEGTLWTLTGLNRGSGVSSVTLDTPLTLEMVEGQASGYAGCNAFAGTYMDEGEKLTFASFDGTEIACGVLEAGMEEEVAYLRNLAHVAQYHISGTELTMEDAEGTQLLVFEAQE